MGLPLTTPVAVPTNPLSIPGKIKRQNCIRARCSLRKEPPLPRAWEPGVCVWGGGREMGVGWGSGGRGGREPLSRFGESVVAWASWGKGDSAPWYPQKDLSPPGGAQGR